MRASYEPIVFSNGEGIWSKFQFRVVSFLHEKWIFVLFLKLSVSLLFWYSIFCSISTQIKIARCEVWVSIPSWLSNSKLRPFVSWLKSWLFSKGGKQQQRPSFSSFQDTVSSFKCLKPLIYFHGEWLIQSLNGFCAKFLAVAKWYQMTPKRGVPRVLHLGGGEGVF